MPHCYRCAQADLASLGVFAAPWSPPLPKGEGSLTEGPTGLGLGSGGPGMAPGNDVAVC